MSNLVQARLTVPEAAYIVGVECKLIDREIDAKIITGSGAERRLHGADLFYLAAIKDVRHQLAPALRKVLRREITSAANAGRREARYHHFAFGLNELRDELLKGFEQLEQATGEFIEAKPDVLGGEPVIKGTRIAARHVADLASQGVSTEEIADDLDLSAEQIKAALVYARTHPKRGRPPARRGRTVHVPAV